MADIIINRNPGFNKIIAFNGQTDFDFTFPIFGKEHLVVIKNTYTALVLDTDYTIITPVQQQTGGTIRLVVPASAGDILTLILSPPVERTTDFQPGGDFIAGVLNTQLDLITQMVQANTRDIERSVRADFGENPELLIEQLLDAAGDAAQSSERAAGSASDAANSATEAAHSAQDAARNAWPRPEMIDNAAGTPTDAVLYTKVKAARLITDSNEIIPDREFGKDASGKIALGDGVNAWGNLADLRADINGVRIATDAEAEAGVLETVAVNPKQLAASGGGGGFNAIEHITTSNPAYTPPVEGWYKITLIGGGGGGSAGAAATSSQTQFSGSGGGGASGNVKIIYKYLTSLDELAITIGAGGAASTIGGTTSLTFTDETVSCYGGYGSPAESVVSRVRRGGYINKQDGCHAGNGHNGSAALNLTYSAHGGHGGSNGTPYGGGGGGGGAGSIYNTSAYITGGGAGGSPNASNGSNGSYSNTSASGGAGGAGGAGAVILEYYDPSL